MRNVDAHQLRWTSTRVSSVTRLRFSNAWDRLCSAAGVGEVVIDILKRVCEALGLLGIALDNRAKEEWFVARHTCQLLDGAGDTQRRDWGQSTRKDQ